MPNLAVWKSFVSVPRHLKLSDLPGISGKTYYWGLPRSHEWHLCAQNPLTDWQGWHARGPPGGKILEKKGSQGFLWDLAWKLKRRLSKQIRARSLGCFKISKVLIQNFCTWNSYPLGCKKCCSNFFGAPKCILGPPQGHFTVFGPKGPPLWQNIFFQNFVLPVWVSMELSWWADSKKV